MSALTFQKMPPENKKAWVDALRSGEYVQARNTLCRADGAMCCLGVAIDVLYGSDWLIEDGCDFYTVDASAGFPATRQVKAMGLDIHAALKLADMNDAKRMSFEEIADWIEQNL